MTIQPYFESRENIHNDFILGIQVYIKFIVHLNYTYALYFSLLVGFFFLVPFFVPFNSMISLDFYFCLKIVLSSRKNGQIFYFFIVS